MDTKPTSANRLVLVYLQQGNQCICGTIVSSGSVQDNHTQALLLSLSCHSNLDRRVWNSVSICKYVINV